MSAKKQVVFLSSFLLLSCALANQASLKAQDSSTLNEVIEPAPVVPEPVVELTPPPVEVQAQAEPAPVEIQPAVETEPVLVTPEALVELMPAPAVTLEENENLLETHVVIDDTAEISNESASTQEQSSETEKPAHVNYNAKLQEYRKSLIRSLKHFTNLQVHYTALKNPTLIAQLKELVGLENLEVDIKNTEELLDGLAVVLSQKLTVYINYLAYLGSLVEYAKPNEKHEINKIEQSLNNLWQTSALNELTSYVIDWNKNAIALGQILNWPYLYRLLSRTVEAYKATDQRAEMIADIKSDGRVVLEQTLIIGIISTFTGTLLGIINNYLQSNIEKIPMDYTSNEVQGLYETIALATQAEEALNNALNLQNSSSNTKNSLGDNEAQTA